MREERSEREDRPQSRPGRKMKRSEKRRARKKRRGGCWVCDGSGRTRGQATPKLRKCGECFGLGDVPRTE